MFKILLSLIYTFHRPLTRSGDDDTWYSIFPVENEELVYSRWENAVIWDPENIKGPMPQPEILTLDPNDENVILAVPEDIDPSTIMTGKCFGILLIRNIRIRRTCPAYAPA